MTDIKEKFLSRIEKQFPALQRAELETLVSDQLLSPFEIKLTFAHLKQAREFVSEIYKLRSNNISQKFPDPGNKSILMSYDFHIDDKGLLKLIEINTNAAFYVLGTLMYDAHSTRLPTEKDPLEKLRRDILRELDLFGRTKTKPKVAIIDEEPEKQRLYIEHLVCRELFRSWGWTAEILDYRKLTPDFDFVYNRYTDFYFENSPELLKMFLEKKMCFSPNPHEYDLLADKERMIEWARLDNPIIQRNLPKAHFLINENKEAIWADRKKFFFKPLRSFGAKQSYKGGSISRKIFDEIAATNEFIAQEFIPAPEINLKTSAGFQDFRYDLRFYVYEDQIEFVVARLYQGQVTNLRTPYGGFAPITFN